MFEKSEVFDKNYNHYCNEISKVDFNRVKDRLGIEQDGDQIRIQFIDNVYRVSNHGMMNAEGNRPDYIICVILAKYILLCPDQSYHDERWVSFKDFKRASHFTNVNFFNSDTEQAMFKYFTGRLNEITRAGEAIGGVKEDVGMTYDLSMRFDVLPNISLLLLFNDRDDEFPAQGTVLFQKHSEFYLDPESLAMASAVLVKRLKEVSRSI